MYASIDIGSNTILLLVAEWKDGHLITLDEKQSSPRLGNEMDRRGVLPESAIRDAVNIVNQYKLYVDRKYSPDIPIIVTGTSAVREAANNQVLFESIRKETGLKLRIIDGQQEAKLTYMGALSTLNFATDGNRLVLDIGGGSTELVFGENHSINSLQSFPMGSVRFTDRFIRSSQLLEENIKQCRKAIFEQLDKTDFDIDYASSLIGVEGTVTSLAHIIYFGHENYRSEQINGRLLSADQIRSFTRWLERTTIEELLQNYSTVMKGRADVFLAGVLILESVMHHYNINELLVSAGGIRHGAILYFQLVAKWN